MSASFVSSCRATAIALFTLLVPLGAAAQIVATSFDELRLKVGPGDRVVVTDASGREAKRTVVEMSASVLAVRNGETRREFAENGVRRITQERADGLLNGVLIGAISGAVAGVALACVLAEGSSCAFAGLPYGAVGLFAGLGIDAAIGRSTLIYEAPPGRMLARAAPAPAGTGVPSSPPVRAAGATIARSFSELRYRLGPRDAVHLTDTMGREVPWSVVEVTDDVLVVGTGEVTRRLTEMDVRRIRQDRPDPIGNGALIGLGVGVGLAAVSIAAAGDASAAGIAVGGAIYGGLGAAAGAGVDALVKTRIVIYEREDRGGATLRVHPFAARGGMGIGATVRF
jgi:hypothetical protein